MRTRILGTKPVPQARVPQSWGTQHIPLSRSVLGIPIQKMPKRAKSIATAVPKKMIRMKRKVREEDRDNLLQHESSEWVGMQGRGKGS